MRKPYFIDTTLRDGEQAPGLAFSLSQKLALCELLDKAGVPELEVGIPAMSENEVNDLAAIARRNFHFKRLAWCRANERDIRQAVCSHVNGVHISFPVSPILQNAMGKNSAWILQRLKELISLSLSEFEYVTIGAQDAGRADMEFLREFVSEAELCGASRVRLADTVGILNPFSTSRLVQEVHKYAPFLEIEIHAHNDLGMATANTVSAYISGASCLSVTVNGIGERAGNAALAEVAMALNLSENIDCGINTAILSELSYLCAEISHHTISVDKPIVGRDVIRHESGIHVNCLLKDRNTYQLFPAAMVGRQESDFVYGMHSGKASIEHFFNAHKMNVDEKVCIKILEEIKTESNLQGRDLKEHEIFEIYNKIKI
jgi:homocitrate synthase NifV